jgi:hypothetical protein
MVDSTGAMRDRVATRISILSPRSSILLAASMWCRQCQQDVPAHRSPGGPLACARCRGTFERPAIAANDSGVGLESFDRPVIAAQSVVLDRDPAEAELRRLGRRLRPRPCASLKPGSGLAVAIHDATTPPAFDFSRVPERPPVVATAELSGGGAILWAPTLVMAAGFAALGLGVAAWATHAAGHATAQVWRWGLIAALSGEGLLAGGLGWMTQRLWRHGRRLQRRVAALERHAANAQARESAPAFSPGLRPGVARRAA